VNLSTGKILRVDRFRLTLSSPVDRFRVNLSTGKILRVDRFRVNLSKKKIQRIVTITCCVQWLRWRSSHAY